MFKKRDIVRPVNTSNGFFYGRVWKVLPDGRVVVICCGLHVKVYEPDDLVISDYKGYTDSRTGKFVRMTSLSKLKRLAGSYNPHFGPHRNAWGYRWTREETQKARNSVGVCNFWNDYKSS